MAANTNLTLNSKLQFTKANQTFTNATQQKVQSSSDTAAKGFHETQDVGITVEDMATGDVTLTAEYMVRLQNHDPTNFVDVILAKDGSTETDAGRMRPGEPFGPIRAKAQSGGYPKYRLKADTAACNVEVLVVEAGVPAV